MVNNMDNIDLDYVNSIQKNLNRIIFKGCEDVLVGDALYYPIFFMQGILIQGRCFKNILRPIKWNLHIIKRILFNKYQYKKNKNSNSLFLFSSSYGDREDLRKTFSKVIGLSPESSFAIYDSNINSFSIWKLKYLGLFRKWNKLLRRKDVCSTGLERTFFLMSLVDFFCDYKDAERFFGKDFAGINILASFCDVHAVDSFFTQKFNAMNKKTVDFMHGAISAKGSNPWSVFGIKSSYFIADSEYTKNLLLENGYKGIVFTCGYPYSINERVYINAICNERVIGVILSGHVLHDENLILCRNLSFLKNMGYKIIAKLHPSEKKGDYPSECTSLFSEIYEKEITSSEFLDKISFAIISSSVVVYEAIYHRIPFIFYGDSINFYKAFDMPDEITAGVDMMEEKISEMLNGSYKTVYKSLIDYYCPKGVVKDNYLNAFKEIGIR